MEAIGGRTVVVVFVASPPAATATATATTGVSGCVVMSVVDVKSGLSGLTSEKLCSNGLGSMSSLQFA